MTRFNSYQNFYFVGIGGIGMSALARYFHESGKKVMGYDKSETKLTSALISEGISIDFKDEITDDIFALTKDNTLVIYTPAIKSLEILKFFIELKFTVYKRARVLGMITDHTECIAIAGTHGKTTTSSLMAHLCKEADLPFSGFLGGIAENFKSNFIFNGNAISVVEADEYDRSFMNLKPDWAVITSMDADHLDIYGDKETIEKSFQDFGALVPEDHQLFIRKGIDIKRGAKTYAVNETADFYADNLRMTDGLIYFDFHTETEKIEDFAWKIPGIHNVENVTAALAILHKKGVDFDTLKKGIRSFKGINRRYTKYEFEDGRYYIDDYAHHPTELNAVIGSIKTFYPDHKLLVVFQPHLFSRTRDFADDFAKSLEAADELILLDVYPARELAENFEGITSSWLLDKINLEQKEVVTLEEAFEKIKEKQFDILLTVGAGNIDTLSEPIIKWLGMQPKEIT